MTVKQSSNNNLFQLIFGSVFLLNAVIFFFQALTKNLFPPLLLPLREAFLIDNAQAGLLVTLVFLGYALARFPSGILADQIGCTKTVLIGSAAMAFSFVGVSLSPGYPTLAVMTFILGVSSGIYVTAGYTLAVIIGFQGKGRYSNGCFRIVRDHGRNYFPGAGDLFCYIFKLAAALYRCRPAACGDNSAFLQQPAALKPNRTRS